METVEKRRRGLLIQSILLASSLAMLKGFAGLAANSVSLLASALDSVMDLFSSSVNLFLMGVSDRPADEDHPYGHGKAEGIAGAIQGMAVSAGALALLAESVRRVVSNSPLSVGRAAIAVMAVSTGLSAWHGRRLSRLARETGSRILAAEGVHFSTDVAANLGVLAALALIYYGAPPAWDIVIAVVVAGYVLKEAASLLVGSIRELMDERLSPETRRRVARIILGHHPSISGFHDMRTRKAGSRVFIDVHVEIAGVEKFIDAHEIAESLTERIEELVPNSDVVIHADPSGER